MKWALINLFLISASTIKLFGVRKPGTNKYLFVDKDGSKFIENGSQKFILSEDKTVKIQNGDLKVWDFAYNANFLYISNKHGKSNQLFTFEKVNGGFKIHVRDKCAESDSDGLLRFFKCELKNEQIFDLEQPHSEISKSVFIKYNGKYLFINSGHTLDISDQKNAFQYKDGVLSFLGVPLEAESSLTYVNSSQNLSPNSFNSRMKFEFSQIGADYQIKNSGKCLSVINDYVIKLTQCANAPSQIFQIENTNEVGNPQQKINTRISNSVLKDKYKNKQKKLNYNILKRFNNDSMNKNEQIQ